MTSIVLTHSPADVVAQMLVNLGAATRPGSYGNWPITIEQEADKPDDALTIYDTTGKNDGRLQINGEVQEHYGIQLRIRAAIRATGAAKLNALVQLLDQTVRRTTVTISSTSYLVHAMSYANRNYLGRDPDNSNRSVFTANYIATITQET